MHSLNIPKFTRKDTPSRSKLFYRLLYIRKIQLIPSNPDGLLSKERMQKQPMNPMSVQLEKMIHVPRLAPKLLATLNAV